MSKLNWEKQNKVEQPKERRRRLDREKVAKAYANGAKNERLRIIKLLEPEVARHYDIGLGFTAAYIERTIEQIKGEQK